MQNNRWFQVLIILLVVIAAAWLAGQVWAFLSQFSAIFLLFFLAWLIAFILRPVARYLTNKGLPYPLSVGVVYLGLALVLTVAGLLLVPVITDQVQQLYRGIERGDFTNTLTAFALDVERQLDAWGVPDTEVTRFTQDVITQIQSVVPALLQNTLSLLQSIATLGLQLILVFLLSFYFMKDGERLAAGALSILPPRWQDEMRLVALSLEKSFGGFIRGQLVFAFVYGVLNAIVMLMPPFQLDYVVIASIVAGLCMIIPLIGNFLAFIPTMLVCLLDPNKAGWWPWLLLALFVMQSFVMNFLGPRIMSSAIGIHPLYVVGAMLIGGQVAGFWGALFGIPVAGAINLIGRPLMRRARHQMPLYQEAAPSQLTGTSAYVTGPLASSLIEARQTGPVHEAQVDAHDVVVATERPTEPHLIAADIYEEEPLLRPQPTPSARALRAAIQLGARAVNRTWARTRKARRGQTTLSGQ